MPKRKQQFNLWKSEPRNKLLFDCRLVAVDDGDQVVHASRYVLAAGSEYFKRLFTSTGFEEDANSPEIPLRDVRFAVLRQAVAFVISDGEELQMDEDNVAELLELGDRLQIDGLADKAAAYLQEHLAAGTAAGAYALAARHNLERLLRAAGEYIAANLTAVASQSPLGALQQLTAQHQLAIMRQCTSDVLRSTAPLDWVASMRERGCTAASLCDVVALLRVWECSADELLQLLCHKMVSQSHRLQLALGHQLHAKVPFNYRSWRPDPAICIDPAYAYTERGGCKQAAVWRIADWASKQGERKLISPPFCIQGVPGWHLACYPKGRGSGAGSHLALILVKPSGFTGKLRYVMFVANQEDSAKTQATLPAINVLEVQGWEKILSLQRISTTAGFIVDDVLTVGVNVVLIKM